MAQHAEVMGQRGFADRKIKGYAGPLGVGREMRERRDDVSPMRIGKRG